MKASQNSQNYRVGYGVKRRTLKNITLNDSIFSFSADHEQDYYQPFPVDAKCTESSDERTNTKKHQKNNIKTTVSSTTNNVDW